MDVPIINETCFSAANPSSYSLAEIWSSSSIPNPNGNGGVLGLRLSAETTTICDDDESSLTEHTRSRKNRRPDANSEIQSSSAANRNAKDLKDSSHKRSKVLGSNHENCGSKAEVEASSGSGEKPTEPVKDYIHVRARRGQATDSHSLAERARREKISERMKILQDLVPGCNKVIGKALVLDEIINYIQSLQNQAEFLSMKLEAVNSRMEPTIEGFPLKNLGPRTLDATGLVFRSQTPREYVQGLQRDWLHIQVGSSIEKQHDS